MPHEDHGHNTSGGTEEPPGSQRLTNDDFRKLLMTPRASHPSQHGSGRDTNSSNRYISRFNQYI